MSPSRSITQLQTKVLQVIPRTPAIKSFRFEAPSGYQFNPGQFLQVTLSVDSSLKKPLSFSNSPTEDSYIEVTKRITESKFSQALSEIKPGDEVSLRFPMGRFSYTGSENKICLLAGGIGITPLRSIAKYITDSSLDTDTVLFYSNRTAQDIAFKDDFDQMEKDGKNLRVFHTLTSPDSDWNGLTGRIDSQMIQKHMPDYSDRTFFLCGPPAMVESLSGMLKEELALTDDQIRSEKFSGY